MVYVQKQMKKMMRIMPSKRDTPTCFSPRCINPKKLVPSKSAANPANALRGISMRKVDFWQATGNIVAEIPNMMSVLMILLPRILVRAISEEPSAAATIFTTSSGADVPNATIVRPMTRSEILSRLAKPDAPFMSQSAENVSRVKPKIKSKYSILVES